MNANAIEGSRPVECPGSQLGNDARTRVPLYFPPGEQRLFGWIHYPSRGPMRSRTGLVVCKPFGYEGICAHRSMRAIAEATAELGIPALLFDYQGTGDSAEICAQADQIAVWIQDVVLAIEEIKRISGVERVCLLGTRLGGLLAIEAARQSSSVDSVILIEPVVSGVRYLREIRRVRLAASLSSGQPLESANSKEDAIDVSGYPLFSKTVNTLSGIDLMKLEAPPAPRALVIDRTDLPSARQWCDAMFSKGADIEYVKLPGFLEMIMTPAESATIPTAMIEKIREWLPRAAGNPSVEASFGRESPDAQKRASCDSFMLIPHEEGQSGPAAPLAERALRFGPDRMLFGVITEPPVGELRKRAVIFLNTGAVHHVGLNRMSVALSRRWARRGYLSLRMDLAGIGDSETRPGRPLHEVFPPTAIEEIRAAIELVRTGPGISDVTLVGTCSGATLALRAAIAGLPVNRIFLVNPMIFFWKKSVSNSDIRRISEAVKNPIGYRQRIFSALHWKRLLTGQVQLGVVPRVYLHRLLLGVRSTVREIARRVRVHLPGDIGWELESIAARGVKIVFIFARDEPGIDLLNIEAGSSLSRLGDRCHVRIIEGGDHAFSEQASRSTLENLLSEELFARREVEPLPTTESKGVHCA
jgi:alpha-beta hydrolase superfamily lysophospholipase